MSVEESVFFKIRDLSIRPSRRRRALRNPS